MTDTAVPGALIDTDDYRSIWMYLKELEFRQGFADIAVNGAPPTSRHCPSTSTVSRST
jgi:hypothetical protein